MYTKNIHLQCGFAQVGYIQMKTENCGNSSLPANHGLTRHQSATGTGPA